MRGLLAVVCASLALAQAGCGKDESSAQERGRDAAPKSVRTARAASRPIGESVLVNGTLDAYERATVGTKVAGRLSLIAVDLGSRVRRGQLVARVEPTDYAIRLQTAQAALAQARARIGLSPEGGNDSVSAADTPTVREARAVQEEARANRERYASLLQEGLVSKADFDAVQSTARVAESRYEDAFEEIRNRQGVVSQRRAEMDLARQQLADTAIYAAFDGVVQQRQASLGEYVAAGAPVAEIVKINPLRLRADVPERDATAVRAGQTVRLTVDGVSREYTGRVTRLAPSITERTRVLAVEADIPNDGMLRAGSFARATIVTNATEPALTVPAAAIVKFAGIEKVVVIKKGKAAEKPVTTGRRTGAYVEILSGLEAGDEVVLSPVNVRTGQSVTVTR
ncbi:MAG: efflux RND transporter periplasmic adaptor subunit [Acidobacteriota bacterium]